MCKTIYVHYVEVSVTCMYMYHSCVKFVRAVLCNYAYTNVHVAYENY